MQPLFLFLGIFLILITCFLFLFIYSKNRRRGITFLQVAWFIVLFYFVLVKCFAVAPQEKDAQIKNSSRSAYIDKTHELKDGWFFVIIDDSPEGSCLLFVEVPESVYQKRATIATITYTKTSTHNGKFIHANFY